MKRDMDLLREIMLKIETDHTWSELISPMIPGHEPMEVAYHCQLLYECGFVSSYHSHGGDDELDTFFVGGLTWDGC